MIFPSRSARKAAPQPLSHLFLHLHVGLPIKVGLVLNNDLQLSKPVCPFFEQETLEIF